MCVLILCYYSSSVLCVCFWLCAPLFLISVQGHVFLCVCVFDVFLCVAVRFVGFAVSRLRALFISMCDLVFVLLC